MFPSSPRGRPTGFSFALLLASICCLVERTAAAQIASTERSAATNDDRLVRAISVPFDRNDVAIGSGVIYAELGAPFDRAKPVLLVIADAQQFYVRRGAMAALQKERFGDALNVVGIVGRGSAPEFVEAARGPFGDPDWEKAYRIFRADEWVEDIEAVRRAIVGAEGKVLLYGRSGGGFLVHQYLARYGRHVTRAVTLAALNPFLVGDLGLNSDRFWKELDETDPGLHALAFRALQKYPTDRARLVMTLQRQNFFVPPDRLPQARADLVRALAAGDDEAYRKARETYQVDQINDVLNAPESIAIRVRLFEFLQPSRSLERLSPDRLDPDVENQRNVAAPLLALHEKGRVPSPSWDRSGLHRLDTEVLVVAGVLDHDVDYRSSVALAYLYPQGLLFLANDDHQSHRMNGDGTLDAVVQAFLSSGRTSIAFKSALGRAERYRWREP